MSSQVRKLFVVGVLSLVLAFVLAACGDDPTPTPRPRAAAVPTPTSAPSSDTTTPAAAPTPTPYISPTATPRPDFDAEAYFKGKTIRLMVGFSPGGGTDAQARYMGRSWSKFIPGNPRMIVTNLTPDLVMRNFVWNAKPDGYTLGLGATPGIFDSYESAAEFTVPRTSFVGGSSGLESFWAIWNEALPYGCIDTASGSSGPAITMADSVPSATELSATSFRLSWLADKLDLPFEVISVAKVGSSAQMLMLERGDINSWSSSTVWSQLPRTRPGWVADGILQPFADLSFPGTTQSDNVEGPFDCPQVTELIKAEDQAEWLSFNGAQVILSKNLWGPPGMNLDVLNTLRKAFSDAFTDEDFVSDVTTFTGIKTILTDGATVQKTIKEVADGFEANQALYNELQVKFYDAYVR